MKKFELLKGIGFDKVVNVEEVIEALKNKGTKVALEVARRIEESSIYQIFTNGQEIGINATYLVTENEKKQISKILGMEVSEIGTIVDRAGLWEKWCVIDEKEIEILEEKEEIADEIIAVNEAATNEDVTMKNDTNVKIAKKYQHMIDEVFKDSDGYWGYTKTGFRFAATECHTAHGNTQKEFLDDIRSLEKCDCFECKEVFNK